MRETAFFFFFFVVLNIIPPVCITNLKKEKILIGRKGGLASVIFHGPGTHTLVTQVRWLCRGPCTRGGGGHSTPAGRLVFCLLRSGSRKRPAWCPSLTRSTRLWLLSPEVPSLRPPLDPSMSIGPLKVRFLGPLSWAGGHLLPNIVRHTSGSRGQPAYFLSKEVAVTTSAGGMCAMTWHRCLARVTQSLDPDFSA